MKLYYAPGACSLSPHILLRETGAKFSLARVDLGRHQVESEGELEMVNPKGKVPVLELDDGQRLTEGAVIAQYIAEQAGALELLPAHGDPARYRVLEWQTFVTTELHKGFGPLFKAALEANVKQLFADELLHKFRWVDSQLAQRDYLAGSTFSVADAYLYTVAGWARMVGPDLSGLAALADYLARIAARPAVRAALEAEGLSAAA